MPGTCTVSCSLRRAHRVVAVRRRLRIGSAATSVSVADRRTVCDSLHSYPVVVSDQYRSTDRSTTAPSADETALPVSFLNLIPFLPRVTGASGGEAGADDRRARLADDLIGVVGRRGRWLRCLRRCIGRRGRSCLLTICNGRRNHERAESRRDIHTLQHHYEPLFACPLFLAGSGTFHLLMKERVLGIFPDLRPFPACVAGARSREARTDDRLAGFADHFVRIVLRWCNHLHHLGCSWVGGRYGCGRWGRGHGCGRRGRRRRVLRQH